MFNLNKTTIVITLVSIITVIFTISFISTSNRLSKQSEIIDSLHMELNACDMENNLFGTILNQIKKTDSMVLINAIDTLEKNQY